MSFKDKKEEVLEIEMTSFGKSLLSKGKFKPAFYAFFDDDIMYDIEYSGDTESQNDTQGRILEKTPSLAVQTSFHSIEDEVAEQVESARKDGTKTMFQNTAERQYALPTPLGKSEFSSNNVPSWDITSYGVGFSNKKKVLQGAHPNLKIPQLDIEDVKYYTSIIQEDVIRVESETGYKPGDAHAGHAFPASGFNEIFDDGRAIQIDENYLILEIDELNTEPLRENYDIEVFIVEEVESVEKLIPLTFKKEHNNIVNGIYTEEQNPQDSEYKELDETCAEYYFNVYVDEEINKDLLCKLGYRTDFSKRGAIRVTCSDERDESQMDRIYDPFGEPTGPYGDEC